MLSLSVLGRAAAARGGADRGAVLYHPLAPDVDRIIGINLIGTLVVIAISILTYLLGEDYLADIAVVYVVLSFIAVAMLCRIYINLYDRRKEETQDDR